MRMFGILPTEFWKEDKLQNLSIPTRLVAIYLYAGPHTNVIGCYRLPISYIAEDLKIQKRFVIKAVKELSAICFLRFDEASKYFAITNFLSTRAKKWLANPNNYIAATRELDEISESIPFKEEIRLQLIEMKRGTSNDDTNNVITSSNQRLNKGKGEGKGEGKEDENENLKGDAQGAEASPEAQPDSPFSFSDPSLPKDFSFPLKYGSLLQIPREQVDVWQAQYRFIVVPSRLQKYQQYYLSHPNKRMNEQGMTTAILKHLEEDNETIKRSNGVDE
jgi:hypothetical protein